MVMKESFFRILIAGLIIASTLHATFAAKEELDERILSPKSNDNDGDEMFRAVSGDDRWGLPPCLYLPPSFYETMLSPNINGEYPDTVKRTFQPWGGKRARITDYLYRLSNWGGKRDPMGMGGNPRSTKSDVQTARRSTFNPWGG